MPLAITSGQPPAIQQRIPITATKPVIVAKPAFPEPALPEPALPTMPKKAASPAIDNSRPKSAAPSNPVQAITAEEPAIPQTLAEMPLDRVRKAEKEKALLPPPPVPPAVVLSTDEQERLQLEEDKKLLIKKAKDIRQRTLIAQLKSRGPGR